MLRPLLVGDAVALVFDECSDLPPLVTDEPKVSQILRNFISNALKFTERGEVRVWATADATRPIGTVTFSVRDTGIGIAPENLELIFEEFGQVPGPIQSKVKGTGLGLPLVEETRGTARRQDRGREHPGAGIGVLADDPARPFWRGRRYGAALRISCPMPDGCRCSSSRTIPPTPSR